MNEFRRMRKFVIEERIQNNKDEIKSLKKIDLNKIKWLQDENKGLLEELKEFENDT